MNEEFNSIFVPPGPANGTTQLTKQFRMADTNPIARNNSELSVGISSRGLYEHHCQIIIPATAFTTVFDVAPVVGNVDETSRHVALTWPSGVEDSSTVFGLREMSGGQFGSSLWEREITASFPLHVVWWHWLSLSLSLFWFYSLSFQHKQPTSDFMWSSPIFPRRRTTLQHS